MNFISIRRHLARTALVGLMALPLGSARAQTAASDLDIAAPTDGGQGGGITALEHFFGIFASFHAQTNFELHIGAHLVRDDATGALGGALFARGGS